MLKFHFLSSFYFTVNLDELYIVTKSMNHLVTKKISQQTFLVFQDVFSVKIFVFQDLLKASSRRLQDVFAIRLSKTSSKRLQDVFKTFSRRLQDVFQDVFKTCLQDVLQLYLQDVLEDKKKCYTEDVFKASSRRLQYVFTKTKVYWDARRDTESDIVIQMILEYVLLQRFKIKEMDEKNNF